MKKFLLILLCAVIASSVSACKLEKKDSQKPTETATEAVTEKKNASYLGEYSYAPAESLGVEIELTLKADGTFEMIAQYEGDYDKMIGRYEEESEKELTLITEKSISFYDGHEMITEADGKDVATVKIEGKKLTIVGDGTDDMVFKKK